MTVSLDVSTSSAIRPRVIRIYVGLVLANVTAWLFALVLFYDQPILLGAALLAYGFGLRHAVDADHIAAIDNVIRKRMRSGERPVGVGLFFALGHSSVVVIAVAIAGTATVMLNSAGTLGTVGGVTGTLVSAFFLFAVAGANIVILRGTWRAFRHVRRGGQLSESDFGHLLDDHGFLTRLARPLFRLVTKSWHMFPLGFLFGIGFETATEVALLGLSATQAAHGLPLWSIMVFPALFAAGMSLVDTTDGILMLGAYDWAFKAPVRKLYYNLTITIVSVLVALLVGSIEVLGLLRETLDLNGGVWQLVDILNENANTLGFSIIGMFIAAWAVSFAIYRVRRLDEVPVRVAAE